jgi:hypothetical protein
MRYLLVVLRVAVVRRRRLLLLALPGVFAAWFIVTWATYPSDRTPIGAYLRVMKAVNEDRPEAFFAYIETAAQHACYTVVDYRKKTRNRILKAYPEPDRRRLAASYEAEARATDGSQVFALYARRRGWLQRLRRDMSGVEKVEIQGDRASVQTVKGTRYPFRRRDNGIWGLTLFTAALVTEAEKAARDAELVEKAAADYERARSAEGRRVIQGRPHAIR